MKMYILLLVLFTFTSCVQEFNFYYFALDMFNKHNAYRALHGFSNTEYNDELAEIALKQATRMAEEMRFFYSNSTYKGNILGENFFYCNSWDGISCLPEYDVTFYWYKEYYTYCMSTGTFPDTARNFITMMWRDTKLMGCGIYYKRYWDCMDAYFLVCEFYPGPHPYLGDTPEEIRRNMNDRNGENDNEKNPTPC